MISKDKLNEYIGIIEKDEQLDYYEYGIGDTSKIALKIIQGLSETGYDIDVRRYEGLYKDEELDIMYIREILEDDLKYSVEDIIDIYNTAIVDEEEVLRLLLIKLGKYEELGYLSYEEYKAIYEKEVENEGRDLLDIIEEWVASGEEEKQKIIAEISESPINNISMGDMIDKSREEISKQLLNVMYLIPSSYKKLLEDMVGGAVGKK